MRVRWRREELSTSPGSPSNPVQQLPSNVRLLIPPSSQRLTMHFGCHNTARELGVLTLARAGRTPDDPDVTCSPTFPRPSGRRERPTEPPLEDRSWHTQLTTDTHDGQSIGTAARVVQAGKVVSGRAPDLQGRRRLIDRHEVSELLIVHVASTDPVRGREVASSLQTGVARRPEDESRQDFRVVGRQQPVRVSVDQPVAAKRRATVDELTLGSRRPMTRGATRQRPRPAQRAHAERDRVRRGLAPLRRTRVRAARGWPPPVG